MKLLSLSGPRLAGAVAVLLTFAATASAAPLRTIVAFDPAARETPENLALARNGTIYVSLAFASEIRRIGPDGSRTSLTIPTRGGITVGVAIDRHHDGDLDVAVRSADPATAGICRVSADTFADPTRIAALPTNSFPNGIAFDAAGNLYVADSNLGIIWRIPRGSSQASVWSESPLLAPTGASFMNFTLPGANGIKVRGSLVYVSNTATENILTIPILSDRSAGTIGVRFTGIQADDFAFAANGDLYVTENPLSKLVRVTPGGEIVTLATQADGLDNPSAVAFDPRPRRRTNLYVTNSAYFGSHPSLEETSTDTVGRRLP
jgi:sugar lactone lactonase YvrE